MIGLRTRTQREQERARQIRQQVKIERRLQVALRREFRRAARDIGGQYEDGGMPAALLASSEHGRRLGVIIERALWPGVERSVQDTTSAAVSKAMIIQSKADDTLATWLERWWYNYVETLLVPVVHTTSAATNGVIQTAVSVALNEGLGQRAAGKLISDRLRGMSDLRAARIARTEVHTANQASVHDAVGELVDDATKTWVTASDSRVRAIREGDAFGHRAMDGKTVPMDGFFLVPKKGGGTEQLRFPGDPKGSAGNRINCRCITTYDTA